MNTTLPGRLFLPMSARSIPREFSSWLHLRSHRAKMQAGQRKGIRARLVLAGRGPEGGIAPRTQV